MTSESTSSQMKESGDGNTNGSDPISRTNASVEGNAKYDDNAIKNTGSEGTSSQIKESSDGMTTVSDPISRHINEAKRVRLMMVSKILGLNPFLIQ